MLPLVSLNSLGYSVIHHNQSIKRLVVLLHITTWLKDRGAHLENAAIFLFEILLHEIKITLFNPSTFNKKMWEYSL
jgi:hypothetical protein